MIFSLHKSLILCNTSFTEYLRTKCRFLNIEILTQWAVDVLAALKDPEHLDQALLQEHCRWVLRYEILIERLRQLDVISRQTRQYVREQGLSSQTGKEIEKLLEETMRFFPFDLEVCQFTGRIIDYLNEQSKLIPKGQTWIGSSEIIESLFGKLKCLEKNQSKGGFTSLVLGAAACVGQINVELVSAAMEQIKSSDVDDRTNKQIGTTVLAKQRRAFGKSRKKKSLKKIGQKFTENYLGEAVCF